MNSSSTNQKQEPIDLDFGDFCTNFEETEEFDGFFATQKSTNIEGISLHNSDSSNNKGTSNGIERFPSLSSEVRDTSKNSLMDFALPITQKVVETSKSDIFSSTASTTNTFNLLDDDWSLDFHSKGSMSDLSNLVTKSKLTSEKVAPILSKSLLPNTFPLGEHLKKYTNTLLDTNDSREISTTHDFGDFTSHDTDAETHGFEEFFDSSNSTLSQDENSKIPDLMNMSTELLSPKVTQIKSSLIDFDDDFLDVSKPTKVDKNSAHLLDISNSLGSEPHLLNFIDWNGSDSKTHTHSHLSNVPIVKNSVNDITPVPKQIETIKNSTHDETESDFGSFSSYTLNNKESFGSLFNEVAPQPLEKENPLSNRVPTVSKKSEIMEEILSFAIPIDDTFDEIDEKFLFEPSLIRGKWNTTLSTIFDTIPSTTSLEDLTSNREINEPIEVPSFVTNSSKESQDFQWENSVNEEKHLASLNLKKTKKKVRKTETLVVQELIPVLVPDVLIETDAHTTSSARQSTELHAPSLTLSLSDSQLSEYFTKESDITSKKRSSGSKFPIGQSILNMFNPSTKKDKSKLMTSVNFDVFDASEIFT
ncbi:hypothetical protein K7432_003774 [Basidiobolus ranarum]|uniref:Aftiphilin clathrin-binding box domain-containing protein n=1 Tax=Basidiobolus ranarum TaxID=34480 RepID=A0ABR2WZ83_9FUNG